MTRLSATYDIESAVGVHTAASVLAGEQSTGTFVKLSGETDSLLERNAATVDDVCITGSSPTPSLPCKTTGKHYERGRVTISWPLENIGTSLPNVLATVAGNLFELAELSAVRLLDIDFPEEFYRTARGPQFGITGTRDLTGVHDRPLLGTIIKPSVGMSATKTAEIVEQLLSADVDFIKDDELQANGPHCPLSERVSAIMPLIKKHEDKTGRRVMYAFNITDEIDVMRANLDMLTKHGASCAMVCLYSVGLPGLMDVRAHSTLAIHGHRAGWGLYSRSPDIGIAYRVWQKLWRLAGADHLHVNGLGSKFSEPDTVVASSAHAVQEPLASDPEFRFEALPVFSSAQTVWHLHPAMRLLGNDDFLMCAGGGIMSHPGGPASGVIALKQAAEAARHRIPIDTYAAEHSELADALDTFNRPDIDSSLI